MKYGDNKKEEGEVLQITQTPFECSEFDAKPSISEKKAVKVPASRLKKSALVLAQMGIAVGLLTGGKFALSAVPNVEIVTLLVMVYAAIFGIKRVIPITFIFCLVEVAIYGIGTWVATYFVYWNLLGILSALILSRPKFSSTTAVCRISAIVFAAVMTLFFGVLSTAVDVVFAALNGVPFDQLGRLFAVYYIRGIWFFAVHAVSNAAIVGICYPRLVTVGKHALRA